MDKRIRSIPGKIKTGNVGRNASDVYIWLWLLHEICFSPRRIGPNSLYWKGSRLWKSVKYQHQWCPWRLFSWYVKVWILKSHLINYECIFDDWPFPDHFWVGATANPPNIYFKKSKPVFFFLPYNMDGKVINQETVYRHSSIYAVNVGTQEKKRGSKNRINWDYLVVLKGRKIGQNYKQR